MSVSKMAEMTVGKAVEWLTSDKAFGQECYSRKQIAALIEQQAAEIEQARATIDTHGALAEHYKRRAEQADVENKRMRDALEEIRCCVTTCNTPLETVHAMDNIAAAALEGK